MNLQDACGVQHRLAPRTAMTPLSEQTSRRSPFVSAWLRPGETFSDVIAGDPRRHVLMLAALGGIATVAVQVLAVGLPVAPLDWRLAILFVAAGVLFGIVSLYLNGLAFRWVGLLFGGHASQAQIRAAIAWSSLPSILALVLCVATWAWLTYAGGAAASSLVIGITAGIAGLLSLWGFVIMLLMLARAQGFGFWRTFATAVVGALLIMAAAVTVRTFAFQPFNTPSGAQKPTLLIGDYFLVSKYA
jgi:hypothetical protein